MDTKVLEKLDAASPFNTAAEKRPEGVFTVYDYVEAKGISYTGAVSRLTRLVEAGVLEKITLVEKTPRSSRRQLINGYRLKETKDADHGKRAGKGGGRKSAQ